MSSMGQNEPLLQYGIALAGVVSAVEAGQSADTTPAFDRAVAERKHLSRLLAWVDDADPGFALPSVALVAMQLRRIHELIMATERMSGGRLEALYDPAVELALARREVQLRVGLAVATSRRELGLSLPEFASRLGIQAGWAISSQSRHSRRMLLIRRSR